MSRSFRKFIKWPVRSAFVCLLWAGLLAGCDNTAHLDTATPIETLRAFFAENDALVQSGWSLRTIYEADGQLYVTLDFPPAGGSRARSAPVFSELVRICPVAGVAEYWDKRSARPFLLYLSKSGQSGAIMMARCLKSFDQYAYDLATSRLNSAEPEYVVLPPDNADLDQIERSNAMGSPSFNEVLETLHSDKLVLLQQHLNKRPELVHLYDRSGRTLLFNADSAEEITVLVAYGARPNVKIKNGGSALAWLSEFPQKASAVKKLIEMGAAAESVEPAYAGNAKIAEMLLENGAVISNNSLYEAIAKGAFDVAEVLYQNGARLDQTTLLVESPLHMHIRGALQDTEESFAKSRINEIKAFLEYGADVNAVNDRGLTPLDLVQQQGSWFGKKPLVDLLTSHGAVSSQSL